MKSSCFSQNWSNFSENSRVSDHTLWVTWRRGVEGVGQMPLLPGAEAGQDEGGGG